MITIKKGAVLALVTGAGLLTAGCSKPTQTSGVQSSETLDGDNSRYDLLVRQGFNHITENEAQDCLSGAGALETQSGSVTGQTVEYKVREVTSISDMRSELSVSATASFSFGFGSAGAQMDYMHGISQHDESRYLMVRTRVGNQLEILNKDARHLSAEMKQLVITNGYNLDTDFTPRCGTKFIAGRRTGGEFLAVFEYEIHTKTESEKFDAAVQGSFAGWSASTSLSTALDKFNSFAVTNVYMFRRGGTGAMPDVTDMKSYGANFNTMVSATSGAGVTLEIIADDYGPLLAEAKQALNQQMLVVQEEYMKDLAAKSDAAQVGMNTVLNVTKHPELYDNGPAVTASETAISTFLDAARQAALACVTDVVHGCKGFTTAVPTWVAPVRHVMTASDICKRERIADLKGAIILQDDFDTYTLLDYGPRYNDPNKRESGIEGWYPCAQVADALSVLN